MAFPFRTHTQTLRQRILVAIGSGGLAGLSAFGCGTSMLDDTPNEGNGAAGVMDTASGGTGSAGTAAGTGLGGTGSAGMTSTAGSGVAGTGTPIGGTMAMGGTGSTPTGGVMAMGGTCPLSGMAPVEECFTRTEMESKARFGCGQIPIEPEPSAAEIEAAFNADGCLPKEMACDGCCSPATVEGMPRGDGSCCYGFCQGACCGRPFVVDGEARLAEVIERRDWLDTSVAWGGAEALPPALRARIAHEWLEDARMEHASIASFARFTQELLACAAPSDLVEDAQRAALDEVAHARACFALAARYDGVARGPSALATGDAHPAATLREAVARAFVEGCVGETLAAACARASLAEARDPEVVRALVRIADDEERHAALAWRFVAWALADGDAALRGELRTDLHAALASALGADATAGAESDDRATDAATRAALHGAGRLTTAERAELMRVVLVDVVRPCAEALLAPAPSHVVESVHEQARA